MIIDPPVSSFSEPQQIQAWIRELGTRLASDHYSPDERSALRHALEEAREMHRWSLTVESLVPTRPGLPAQPPQTVGNGGQIARG